MGVWKAAATSGLATYHFYPYLSGFIQNSLFWAAISFAFLFIWITVRSEMPLALLPAYVVGLSWARIQLEFQMAIAAMGSIIAFTRIDQFSYAQITAYFAMALLLFPVVITAVTRLNFKQIFRLCSLGFPIILLPPVVDNYVLAKPVVYNFFTSSSHHASSNLLSTTGVLSVGIKIEILLVATSTLVYLFYRTRSIMKSASAVLGAFLLFVFVSTPTVTSPLKVGLSQPQLFAGYLVLTYALIIVSLSLAQSGLGGLIVRRIRVRGTHFPAMTLFGLFLVHPTILATSTPEDLGVAAAGTFIVFLVWQTAVVFDDLFDRGQKAPPGYLALGILVALMAILAAIPLGPVPWLLALVAIFLAIEYPRLKRKYCLLPGAVIGVSSCIAFLYGAALPVESVSSTQPVASFALAILVMFSGASLLKDITSVETDAESGIPTVFTKFDTKSALPIVAAFVAFGFAFPAALFGGFTDRLLFIAAGACVWFLVVHLKHKSYQWVLALYFIEGVWVFYRKFICLIV
jgi:4-hydroxybenzoate polyprenyltransferase